MAARSTSPDAPPPGSRLFAGLPFVDASALTYEAALRACLGQAIPLLVLFAIGRIDLGIYASFAGFTAIYGRSEPYRSRWISVGAAACGLTAAVLGGVLVHLAGDPWWLMALGLVLVIGVTLPLSYAMELIPRGSIFFVFAYLACAAYPVPPGGLPEAAAVTLASAALSWMISMAGWPLRRIPAIGRRLRPLPHLPVRRVRGGTDPAILQTTAFAIAGALAAGLLAAAVDVAKHHYWAMVTVAAIFSAPGALVSFERLAHRVIGTLAGVGLAAALFGSGMPALGVILTCIACSFVVEVVIGLHYGAGLTFVTPLAIGASNLGLQTEWGQLFVDRSRETILGGAVTFAIILALRLRLLRRGELRERGR